jgi:MFS family permease
MSCEPSDAVVPAAAPGPHRAERMPLTALLFGLSFIQGLALNLMPVLFPTLGVEFGISKAQQGLLQTAFTAGTISVLIAAGYLINYFGAKHVARAVTMLIGLGAILFGLAPYYALVLCGAMLMGMGTACLVPVYAAVITARFADIRQRMYMWTFAVLAGSATVSTALAGDLVQRYSYHVVFVAFGLLIWIWAAALLGIAGRALDPGIGRVRAPPVAGRAAGAATGGHVTAFLRFLADGLLNRAALYALGLVVVLDTLASGNLLAWAPSYFGEAYGLVNVGVVLSASSAGVFVGRVVMGVLPPDRVPDRILLGLCYAGAMVAFGLILILRPGMYAALGLIALNGALVAAQSPLTYSIATTKFGNRAPAAIPLVDAMGNFGALLGPPLVGLLADRAGELKAVMGFIPLCGFALVGLLFVWEAIDRPRRTGPAAA